MPEARAVWCSWQQSWVRKKETTQGRNSQQGCLSAGAGAGAKASFQCTHTTVKQQGIIIFAHSDQLEGEERAGRE